MRNRFLFILNGVVALVTLALLFSRLSSVPGIAQEDSGLPGPATGVAAPGALATTPTTTRLRNSRRDRATGQSHVTAEEGDERTVQGVRLVEVPAR